MATDKIMNFIKKLKGVNEELLKPKFEAGDYIRNKKFDTFAKIVKIHTYGKDIEGWLYSIKYLKNPKAIDMGIGLEHNRNKKVKAIDAYYEKVDPKAAALLFSSKKEIKKVSKEEHYDTYWQGE